MRATFPLAVVIASGIVYHLAQKSSGAASPWPMLAIAYGAAFALALALMLARPAVAGGAIAGGGGGAWIAGLLLGLAAFGIEAGFFFIYRGGWPLASASVIANVAVTSILAIIGIAVFGERLTLVRVAGLALAAGGAAMIARG